MKISVITVCYNAASQIEKTAKSIMTQRYDNYEWLIIDGNSKDDTLDVLRSVINDNHYNVDLMTIISEPDNGIYDAMNKGVRIASGDFVIFMNAGDAFYNDDVLEAIDRSADDNADIIYGDTWLIEEYSEYAVKADNLENLPYNMPFCHQSVFTRRRCLTEMPFDLNYKICSDLKFYYECQRQNKTFQYIPIIVSRYDCSGISSVGQKSATKERFRLLEEYQMVTLSNRFHYVLTIFQIQMKDILKKLLPREYTEAIKRRKQSAKAH